MERRKTVIVTGGSRGIGAGIVQFLAEKNKYNIVLNYNKSEESARKIKEELNSKKIDIEIFKADVSKREEVKKLIEFTLNKFNNIDVLINNAGMGIGGALELATEDEISGQMNTNFFGVVNMCKVVLPYMRKARRGKIINISSIGGVMGIPYQGFYSASKFAVEGYSEALALEVHPFHIKVCIVEPGDFNTGFTDNRNISEATIVNTDYKESFLKSLEIIEKEERNGCHPKKLGHAICKIVACKNPPFRTKVGPWIQVTFAKSKKWLPDVVMQYALRIFYAIQ